MRHDTVGGCAWRWPQVRFGEEGAYYNARIDAVREDGQVRSEPATTSHVCLIDHRAAMLGHVS